MKAHITYSCGHEGVVEVFGGMKAQEAKIHWFETEGLCPECYKKHLEEVMQAFEAEHNLPELKGSEKQISWARKIRKEFVEGYETKVIELAKRSDKDFHSMLAEVVKKANASITDAKKYIDNRDNFDGFFREIAAPAITEWKKNH